jgi:8-amino-7-oxononanoate synthase
MLARLDRSLQALRRRNRRRFLFRPRGRDFASNDYLALSTDPALREAVTTALEAGTPVGAGASRLLRGNHSEHESLETEAAAFFGAERALYFGSGYSANAALLSTLPRPGDLVLHDALSHASVHDGLRGARCPVRAVVHNDAEAVDDAISAWRDGGGAGIPWIVVESLYSMDGDRAPLADLAEVADRRDAVLIVDEAHATGVFGPTGRGLGTELAGRANVITVHTCGKALGVAGALVCGPATLIDFLVNRCAPFIYATAPSPMVAAAVRRSLHLLQTEPERQHRLAGLIDAGNRAAERTCGVAPTDSQIIPVVLGSDARATAVAERLQTAGFDVRAIRPPTVPEGTARLRVSLTLHVREADVTAMFDHLGAALAREAA